MKRLFELAISKKLDLIIKGAAFITIFPIQASNLNKKTLPPDDDNEYIFIDKNETEITIAISGPGAQRTEIIVQHDATIKKVLEEYNNKMKIDPSLSKKLHLCSYQNKSSGTGGTIKNSCELIPHQEHVKVSSIKGIIQNGLILIVN